MLERDTLTPQFRSLATNPEADYPTETDKEDHGIKEHRNRMERIRQKTSEK